MPAAKCRWATTCLPILHRERLVARADMAPDRQAGLLRVLGAASRPGVRHTPALDRAIMRVLERLAVCGAQVVSVLSTRGGTIDDEV